MRYGVERLLKKFDNIKLKHKLILTNGAVLLIPILLFATITFNYNKKTIIQENIRDMAIELTEEYNQIQNNIEAFNISMQFIENNTYFIDFLSRNNEEKNYSIEQLIEFNQKEVAAIQRLVNINPYISSVRVYLASSNLPEMWPVLYHNNRLEKFSWYNTKEQEMSPWQFNYSYQDEKSTLGIDADHLIGRIKKIYDMSNEYIGLLETSASMEGFFPGIYNLNDEHWEGFIKEDNTLYWNVQGDQYNWKDDISEIIRITRAQAKEDENFNKVFEVNGNPMIIGYQPIKNLNGGLIKVISLEKQIQSINHSGNIFILEILVLFIILTFILNKIINIILGKFYYIIRLMKKLEKGHLDIEIPDLGKDEVGELALSFKKMHSQIGSLIDTNIKKEILAKDSELRALQNQINAHFIYNVLESIKMMAEIEESYHISDSVTALGRLLRYSMRWKSQMVSLQEEVEYVKNYLILLNLRYDYTIILSIDIPKVILEQEIPKMSLQPIIENAVLHGIEELAEDTTIYIKGKVVGDKYYIEVTDTGKGMNEDEFTSLRRKLSGALQQEPVGHSGIGLNNVKQRLLLCFGNKADLEVSTKQGCYTKVRMVIPIIDQ